MNAQETDLTEAPAKKRRRPRLPRFSMLREFTLADVITLGNGFSGMSSVLCAMQFLVSGERAMLWIAFALLPLAGVFDYLDGRVARWRLGRARFPSMSTTPPGRCGNWPGRCGKDSTRR